MKHAVTHALEQLKALTESNLLPLYRGVSED